MSESTPFETNQDFDLEQAYMSLFIQQSRVYDVLMALLTVSDPAKAADLLELHAQGFLVASVPAFNGTFIASVGQEIEDETNDGRQDSGDGIDS